MCSVNKIVNMYRFLIKRTLITNEILKRKTNDELADTVKSYTKTKSKKQGKYSETILLPQTQFRVHLNGKTRIQEDKYLTEKCGFSELYDWQKKKIFQDQILFYMMDLLMQMEFPIWDMLLIRFLKI